MNVPDPVAEQPGDPPRLDEGPLRRIARILFGKPRDVRDPSIFHHLSLVAVLAWVGLGADGLSSSAYGPEEAFRALGEHRYLALFLALATALTVLVISYAYSRVIEQFPHGGGGYVVATKLLGRHAGVISGGALLVDYVLTITVSIASGADAIFSFLPPAWIPARLPVAVAMLLVLIVLNLRGVKESVKVLAPIFGLFLLLHLVLIAGGVASHASELPGVARTVGDGLSRDLSTVGALPLFLLFVRAYSLGGGTYTGIEAVSNGLQIMREPRVQTGRRTMAYMAISLALTAGGILVCYLLFDVRPAEGRTLNAVLAESFFGLLPRSLGPVAHALVVLTLLSEGALLFVAAQTGFIDGPRVMANLAVDSWLPHRFSSLSDRLTTRDGIVLMGTAAIALLVYTRGSVSALVVMYSINVFVTFSLSQLAMCRLWLSSPSRAREPARVWLRRLAVHAIGLVLCASILAVTVYEKFGEGGWLTVVITAALVLACEGIRGHYARVQRRLAHLDHEFEGLPGSARVGRGGGSTSSAGRGGPGTVPPDQTGGEPAPDQPTAVLLVGRYGGIGVHSLLSLQRMFPGYFKNVVFLSVSVIDSGSFKGAEEIAALEARTHDDLARYVDLAKRLGWNAAAVTGSSIDATDEITRLCVDLAARFPRVVFFAGKLIWQRERWWQRFLHNETSYQVQRRLQWKGLPMTVIPLRVGREEAA